jgi:hypothetical protein
MRNAVNAEQTTADPTAIALGFVDCADAEAQATGYGGLIEDGVVSGVKNHPAYLLATFKAWQQKFGISFMSNGVPFTFDAP